MVCTELLYVFTNANSLWDYDMFVPIRWLPLV